MSTKRYMALLILEKNLSRLHPKKLFCCNLKMQHAITLNEKRQLQQPYNVVILKHDFDLTQIFPSLHKSQLNFLNQTSPMIMSSLGQ